MGAFPFGVLSRPATRIHFDSALEVELTVTSSPTLRERFRQQYIDLDLPETLPPYSTLWVDPDEVLWGLVSTPGDGETRLHAVDREGRAVGELLLPADFTVLEVGLDYVLGMRRDALDRQTVVVHRLHRE